VAGMIGCWIAGLVLVCALAVMDCSFGVIAVAALGTLAVSVAWERLDRLREIRRMRAAVPEATEAAEVLVSRSPWKEHDEAVLNGDLSLGAWERAGQLRQGDAR